MNRREYMQGVAGLIGAAAISRYVSAADGPVALPNAPMIAGPDPDTRTPTFKAPKGAVDTHCHIFGPVSRYPYVEKRSYTPPEATLVMFRELHRKIGIERAVIVNPTVHGFDNRPVTDAIAQSNGNYRGLANVNDKMTDRELEDLARAGIKGCRFIFIARLKAKPDMTAFDRIMQRIKPLGWHVDLYLRASDLGEWQPRLRALPVDYVLDHMGLVNAAEGLDQPAFKALVTQLANDPKCHIKITGPERISRAGKPFHDAIPFASKLIETAPDRVIWGTDWPHPNVKIMPNDGDLVDMIPLYAPDPALQHKLLVENPERLFGFAKA